MKKYALLFIIVAVFAAKSSIGQLVTVSGTTRVFLQGNYLEIGMRNIGSFGANNVPTGYHPYSGGDLGEVYDYGHDGWAVGTPAYLGDYTVSGTPYECWALQVNGGWSHAFSGYSLADAMTHGGTSPSWGSLTGGITGYSGTGGSARAIWTGTAAGGQLAVNSETRLDAGASHVLVTVKLRNVGTTPLPGIYYFRSCDPDMGMSIPGGGGGMTTTNTVIYQNDTANRVLVKAGYGTFASLCLGARDSRAKALWYSNWPLSITTDLAPLYSSGAGAGSYSFTPGVTIGSSDWAIGLVFNLGTLAAGDSTSFSYAYIFNGVASFDSIFMVPCAGMPSAGIVSANTNTACSTTPLTLNLSISPMITGLVYQWQSSADSATWSNVSGATSLAYSFSSLTTTTYYRCKVTCSLSGLTTYSAGKKIIYTTACPCLHNAGVMYASNSSACPTAVISLTDTGYTVSTGVSLQWQSSPDSSIWSNISGATTVPYTFTGLTATTYYRLKTTCTATGLVLYSNVRKIIFTTVCICTGTPSAGITVASTTFCSSCSLTLNLSAATVSPDITYQWQRSVNSTSWSAISGATNMLYVHAPINTYYYRCKVTCTTSGASSFSSSVLVIVPNYIIADSVKQITDTSCSDQLFYVRASGQSIYPASLKVKTYFGDGSSQLNNMINAAAGQSYVNVAHIYVHPGCYTVKQVLYYNDTLRQDSITFTYSHPGCDMMRLKFYNDVNHNCVKETTEPFSNLPISIKVDSAGLPIDTMSVMAGCYYRALGLAGTVYSFTILPGAVYPVCPSSGILYDTVSATGSYNHPVRYMGFDCSSSAFDFTQFVIGGADLNRCRFFILVRNLECAATDCYELLSFSPKYKYTGPLLSFSMATMVSYTDQSIAWTKEDVSCLMPYMFYPRMTILKTPLVTLTIGDTVNSSFLASQVSGDSNPANNLLLRVDTVIAAYDPNMIEVTPPGCFDNDTTLQFTVHFENMGNDTAHNVYVLDTLSPNLDWRSLELLATSAEMDVYYFEDGGYRIVKFDFPNIKLLDSSLFGLNDGMFVYKIKTQPGLAVGQSIFSRVGIYFDYNDVVMTNTVQNTKGCPVVSVPSTIKSNNILLYPNPATDELTIKTEQGAFTSFTITNTMGQQMMAQDMVGTQAKVNVKALPAGMYYVTLRGAQGSEVRKFVKW